MPQIQVNVESPVHESFRVQQVAGMFDVPLAEATKESFEAEVPALDEDWQIGAIVGPSGSGKSTIAAEAFGTAIYKMGRSWSRNKAVIDDFPKTCAMKEITSMLCSVGFSSPPSWVKPFAVLSNGEQFRCELARALLRDKPLVVFDEFTSVVDRTVAKIGSRAVAKAIRRKRIQKRFVAVSCHSDILPWLQPDWTLDMATRELARGHLQRPPIKIEIVRCRHEAWSLFERHHYLNRHLNTAARCYMALWDRQPVAFCAILPLLGRVGRDRISRLVTLPDYQGVGIGGHLLDALAVINKRAGRRTNITTSHPAMIARLKNGETWRCVDIKRTGGPPIGKKGWQSGPGNVKYITSAGRAVVSFEYRGQATG